jgi:hypothetical protein
MLKYTLGPERRDYSFGPGIYMKIDNDLRKCVVFLGIEDNSEKSGIYCAGTGFLLGYNGGAYLVTAKHVAKALGDNPFIIRINRKDGSVDNLHVDHIEWGYHPDESVDIAIIECLITQQSIYDALYLPDTLIAAIGEKNIGIGDMCYTIGLFRFLTGVKRNLPVVHTGNVAMVPSDEKVPVRDSLTGKTEYVEAYLIESQSVNGLSGSPVFARPTMEFPFGRNDDKGILGSQIGLKNIYLIGIWQSAWNASPDEIMMAATGMNEDKRVSYGMGVVVPIYKLIELLEIARMLERREAQKALWEANIPAAEMESAIPPVKADNPQHKEDFNSLLTAAAKKKTQED